MAMNLNGNHHTKRLVDMIPQLNDVHQRVPHENLTPICATIKYFVVCIYTYIYIYTGHLSKHCIFFRTIVSVESNTPSPLFWVFDDRTPDADGDIVYVSVSLANHRQPGSITHGQGNKLH